MLLLVGLTTLAAFSAIGVIRGAAGRRRFALDDVHSFLDHRVALWRIDLLFGLDRTQVLVAGLFVAKGVDGFG